MDSNKFYCRNATPASSSTLSLATTNGGNTAISQEYGTCDSTYSSSAAFNCKESLSRSNNGKQSHSQRGNGSGTAYGSAPGSTVMSASGSVASSVNNSAYCGSNINSSNGSGNYINVMSVPMGTLQYHRRKLTPQEYQ